MKNYKFKMKSSVAYINKINETQENIVNGKRLEDYFYNNNSLIHEALSTNIDNFIFSITVKGGGNRSQAIAVAGTIRRFFLKDNNLDPQKRTQLRAKSLREHYRFRRINPKNTGLTKSRKGSPSNRR